MVTEVGAELLYYAFAMTVFYAVQRLDIIDSHAHFICLHAGSIPGVKSERPIISCYNNCCAS